MKRRLPPAFERLAEAEREFRATEFLAPVLRGQRVSVRIAGVVCAINVEPKDFAGWGVFQPYDRNRARFVRHPRMSERAEYLALYPRVRLILSGRQGNQWFGRSATQGAGRVRLTGDAPLAFAEDIQVFDTVRARFDGGTFWHEGRETGRARFASYLRDSLAQMVEPAALALGGLTPEERGLYAELSILRAVEIEEAKRDKTEDRLRAALTHAGAVLQGYRELPDAYTVEYTVDNRRHTSVLAKGDLTVQAAGICLSGGDRAFDLQSLVGVIREGEQRHRIVRVGLNADHEDDDDDEW
jgi:hypothetical protein